MELFQNDFKLAGDHFICNIAMDENLPGGLIAVERDPRNLKHKPDAYVARIEKIGPGCKHIRPGHKIVVERFDWLQYDLDDERIIAREIDVIILDNDLPAPGVAVVREISEKEELQQRSNLYIPDAGYKETRGKEYVFGSVLHSNVDFLKPEMLVWMLKTDKNQWRLTKNILVFRPDDEMVLMVGEKNNFQLQVA